MRIRIVTIGSQGDVRPYVAFGVGLRRAGHDVRILAHAGFEELVRSRGLDFAPVAGDPRELAVEENRDLRNLHEAGRNPFRWWHTFNKVDAPFMRQRLRDCWEGCRDAEVIVVSMLPYLFGYAIAKKLGIPLVRAFYSPVSPTRSAPVDALPPWLQLGQRFNLATYHVQRQVLWEIARPWVAEACREVLGIQSLPRREPFSDLDRRQQLLLYAYSEAVAPRPQDWGDWIEVTGYWFLDRASGWTPPPALTAFLEDGAPPVCVGFGSMTYDRPEILRIVSDALNKTGQRAVLLAGWGGLRPPELPRHMFTIDWAPLNWLFPRMSAVVHHGGAGTTSEGLRAGVPTVVVPFFYDQFFWARRVFAAGAGPEPIPRTKLSADTLARSIRIAASDQEIRRRVTAISRRIQAEDGVARAVVAFERHLRRSGAQGSATIGQSSLSKTGDPPFSYEAH
jgi:UDP:flavonoid glycosyltransferase YjiC (YdhE family)